MLHDFEEVGQVDRYPAGAEYVEGGTLQDWIKKRRLSSIGEILDVAIQLAWGLDFSHTCGLVHQDIKPANILLSSDMVAKITDFGLARAGAMAGISLASGELGSSESIMVTIIRIASTATVGNP